MSSLLVLLLVLPLAAALASAFGKTAPRLPVGPVAGLLALAASLGLLGPLAPRCLAGGMAPASAAPPLVYELGSWGEPVGIALYMDGLAWLSSAIGLVVAGCALVFALSEARRPPSFYFFFLLLVFGMQGVILTGDLFNLFVFLEVLSIASYVLIAGARKPEALVAALRYLMISSLGIAFFLLGTFLLYRATGVLSLRLLAGAIAGAAPERRRELELAVACLTVGAGVKAAFLPFHTWLPDAHGAAPHAVSAVLSGVIIKISFLVVWRLLRLFAAADLQGLLLWVGAFTAVFGVVAALSQVDAKRLLAYHSVSQVGYIAAAFGAGAQSGPGAAASVGGAQAAYPALGASLYHVLSHSLFKSLLFLAVGAVIHLSGEQDLRRLGGLARRRPLLFVVFLVGALSISGLPPFNGYVSKGLVSASLKEHPLAYALILVTAAGTLASMLKLSGIFIRRPPQGSPAAAGREHAAPLPAAMVLSLSALALLCLATGLAAAPLGRLLAAVALGCAPKQASGFTPSFAELYSPLHLAELGASVVAGVGIYLLAVRTGFGPRLLRRLRSAAVGMNAALGLLVGGLLGFVLLAWLT